MAVLFDVVDRHDQPIGRRVTKQEAHAKRLVHRCIAIYVFDRQGKVYLQVHKAGGGLLDHSVGGHVDGGEDYRTAAYREAEEELGITNTELHEIMTSFYADEGDRIHMFGIYECHVGRGWTFVPNEEVDEIVPYTLDEVVAYIEKAPHLFTGGIKKTLPAYLQAKGHIIKT